MALIPECEYEEILPPNLFLCPDNVNSMHFVILLKHMACDQREELKKVLMHCGASLSYDVQDITDHSAIIVDHDDVVSDKAPAFTLEFIRHCLYDGRVKDITSYRQLATEQVAKNYNCMDVVYYRKIGWSDVFLPLEKKWLYWSVKLQQYLDSKIPPASSSQDLEVASLVIRELPSDEDSESVERDEDVAEVNTQQRAEKVEKSLGKDGSEKTCRKSPEVWLSRQRKKRSSLDSVCKAGTSVTLTQTSTTSRLSSDEDSESVASDKREMRTREKTQRAESNSNQKENEIECKKTFQKKPSGTSEESFCPNCKMQSRTPSPIPTLMQSTRKWPFLNDFDSDSDLEESSQGKETRERDKNTNSEQVQSPSNGEEVSQKSKPQREEMRENNSMISPNEVQSGNSDEEGSQPKKNKKKFSDFAAAEEDLFDPKKDKKHTRMPYSYEERSKILNYIIRHNEFSRLKGREMWMVMERRKVCPNRTWQSMKEHFLKKIVMNLEAYDFLTEHDRVKFRQSLFL